MICIKISENVVFFLAKILAGQICPDGTFIFQYIFLTWLQAAEKYRTALYRNSVSLFWTEAERVSADDIFEYSV